MREEAKRGVCRVQGQCAGEQCDAHPDDRTSSIVSRFGCEPGNGCARSARTPEGPAGARARVGSVASEQCDETDKYLYFLTKVECG